VFAVDQRKMLAAVMILTLDSAVVQVLRTATSWMIKRLGRYRQRTPMLPDLFPSSRHGKVSNE